jgi:MFS family permease
MIWLFVIGPFCLAAGLVLARFRRKDKGKGEPRKKVAVFATALILVFSLCMFWTPIAGACVNLGAWMVDTAKSGGVSTVFGYAVIALTSFALGLLVVGVIRDIAKDGVADRPTFIAAAVVWAVAAIAFGVVFGPTEYDRVTVDVMKATVNTW